MSGMPFSDPEERVRRTLQGLSLHEQERISSKSESPSTPSVATASSLLGQIALRRDLITQAQLAECLLGQKEALARGERILVGQILVRCGFLTSGELAEILEEQEHFRDQLSDISRYQVEERVGEGATAMVFRAWDRQLKRRVAIKLLKEAAGWSPITQERFRREAQTAAGVSHPNVDSAVTKPDLCRRGGRGAPAPRRPLASPLLLPPVQFELRRQRER